MYLYSYGAISQAVHKKIENFKSSVRSGEKSNQTFADALKAELTHTGGETKVVSSVGNNTLRAENKSDVPKINGSTLLYAIQNSEEDTTASTVLSDLGFTTSEKGSVTELKTTADALSKTAADLVKLNEADADTSVMKTKLVDNFNKLITILNSESSSSAYLYKNALTTAVLTSESELSSAGISIESGYMAFSGQSDLSPVPDAVLNNIALSAGAVSTYAGTLTSDTGENYNGVSDYYNAIIRSYM